MLEQFSFQSRATFSFEKIFFKESSIEGCSFPQRTGGGDEQLTSPLTQIGGFELAKLASTNLIGPLKCDGEVAEPVTFQILPSLHKYVRGCRKCSICHAGLPRRQSEQKYCDSISLDLFSLDSSFCILHFLVSVHIMGCRVVPHEEGRRNAPAAWVLRDRASFRASSGRSRIAIGLFFFFFSSSWLIKMLEGPAAGAAMTGENQLLYPLLFVGWAQNFGDFARFLVLLLQKEWQKGVEVRRL